MRKKLNFVMVIVLSLLLSGCVISGTITDEFGTGIEGVEIILNGNDGDLTIHSDVDGNYAFRNILPGKYTITASSEDYTFTPATVNANKATTTVDFEGETLARFTDMGNGTVRDNDSGLIWLKDAGALGAHSWHDATGAIPPGTTDVIADFNAGTEYGAEEYTAGTYTDWRLPDKDELDNLVNGTEVIRCTSGPCNVYDFVEVQPNYYWSSTGIEAFAWFVDMRNGNVDTDWRDFNNYVWPVRSDN